jgi:hypothetical protein
MINMIKKTYTSKEVCEMFNLSAPRLLQFRKGQKVRVSTKNENEEPRTYEFDPILIEGEDWEWNGSEVVFNESSIIKLKERKAYRKYQHRMSSDRGAKSLARRQLGISYEPKDININNLEFSVQEIAEEMNLSVQKIYALRDISSNKPVSFTNYLKLNKDWKYDDGKVILFRSARQKIQEYANMLKEKEEVPKTRKITVLIGNKVFHLQGEASNAVIRIIEQEQLSKKKNKA